MGKIYNYAIAITAITVIMGVMGFNTGSTQIIQTLLTGSLQNILSSITFVQLVSLLSIAGATIVASFVTGNATETFLTGSFVLILSNFVFDLISVLTYLQLNYPEVTFLYYISYIIIGPLIAGYVVALLEFWRGTDG